MDALGRGVLTGSRLSQNQNRNIALGKLPDYRFHWPHAGADAFHKGEPGRFPGNLSEGTLSPACSTIG
jgi:hypothetical protein